MGMDGEIGETIELLGGGGAAAGELKHYCRICKRRFACGRALGGHMRVHGSEFNTPIKKVKMLGSIAEEEDHNHNESKEDDGEDDMMGSMYELRRNPKRSWRFSDQDDPDGGVDESRACTCSECGKQFGSWKALFGHMRAHSDKQPPPPPPPPNTGREDNWQQETSDDNHGGVKGKEIASYDDVDIANCLMLLARGGPPRAGDNSVVVHEEDVSTYSSTSGSRNLMVIPKSEEDDDNVSCRAHFRATTKGKHPRTRYEYDDEFDYHGYETEERKRSSNTNKYECKTCRKSFHSYQALGGHRASHKKAKGALLAGSSFVVEDVEEGEDHSSSRHEQQLQLTSYSPFHKREEENEGSSETIRLSQKPKKLHECSVCHRVFTSGQALGGHKRSHMSDAEATVAEKPKPKNNTRQDWFDLNIPATQFDVKLSEHTITDFKPFNTSPLEQHAFAPNYTKPWWVRDGVNEMHKSRLRPHDDEAESKPGNVSNASTIAREVIQDTRTNATSYLRVNGL